jgi:hypothetical protein
MAEKKKGIVKQLADDQVKFAPQAVLEDLFEDYYQRRREIYFMNLIRGIFFGFGGVIGGTIVVALLLWLLSVLQYVPFLDGITDAAQQTLQNSRK